MRIFLTLLVALIWGIGSWWWYTCKVKGFCGSDSVETAPTPVAEITPPTPVDTDGDGLADDLEQTLGLDPNSDDSDKDGLKDAVEVGENTEQATDSDGDDTIDTLDNDDDNDTIATQDELADANADGDPADAVDTDGDGTANYLDTDSDGDGLSDANEVRLSLNPLVADSDGDGIDDGTEAGSDINSPLDTDDDGIIDALDTEDTPKIVAEPEQPVETEKPTAPEKPEANSEAGSKANAEDQVSVDTIKSEASTIDAANIYFPFRSANPQLSGDAKSYFEKVVTALKDNSELKISLIGHTDNVGSDKANKKLGLERANIIKQTLVDQGASESQMETSSQGEASPIASNDTQEGRDQNRRVELLPQ